ncbi:MAG: HNH endonuclease domain-containing protein, partial [Sphaerochaetaceae bacterium]|nr:HNH endonuclease domain-containing protein [Sphaerochaetaceae bacterium]
PYCNRNYTFVIDEESEKIRAEIDHFYPKSIYPFLAMSFYNLIPSCSICNHTKKDKVSLDLINPYDIEIDDFRLTYKPNNIDFYNVENEKYNFNNFEINFTTTNKNIETFKLKELYKQHKDIVLELLIKKAYYPKSYIEELKGFGFGEDEIYRYLLCNYNKEEDLHKRPLSKLIKDISKELGLI